MYLVDAARSLLSPVATPPQAWLEMGAYEALWQRPSASFKAVSDLISAAANEKAADLVSPDVAEDCADQIRARFAKAGLSDIDLRFYGGPDYPEGLKDARHPLRAFYSRGDWELLSTPTIAVVGARQLTEDGAARTRRLVRCLDAAEKLGIEVFDHIIVGRDGHLSLRSAGLM